MVRNCLIIDNEDQSEEIEKLIRDAKNAGVDLNCVQFHVGNPAYDDVLTDGKIEIEKVVKEFNQKYKNITFHLVAFDWDLEDEITGVELIRKFEENKVLRSTPRIVYSGLLDEILKDIITKGNSVNNGKINYKDFDKKIKKLKSLIGNGIRGYHEREKRDIQIIKYFTEETDSLDLVIEEIFRNFPNLIFRQKIVNENFNNKKFEDISIYIDDNPQIKNEFKKKIITQVISYITEKI